MAALVNKASCCVITTRATNTIYERSDEPKALDYFHAGRCYEDHALNNEARCCKRAQSLMSGTLSEPIQAQALNSAGRSVCNDKAIT